MRIKIMNKKLLTILEWVIFIIAFIWQLPQNIIALLMMPFMGKMRMVSNKHYNYCFKCSNMRGGISLGSFCYVNNSVSLSVISHEQNGHGLQSLMLGPLYLLIIGLPSLLWVCTYKMLGFKNYYKFYTESWANKLAKLKVIERYPGVYILRML